MITIFLAMCFFVGCSASNFDLTKYLLSKDLGRVSDEDEHDLMKLHKYISKKEAHLYQKEFKKELAEDEDNQEKYFSNLSQSVQKMGHKQLGLDEVLKIIAESHRRGLI